MSKRMSCSAGRLREWSACPEQLEKVVAEWGEGEFEVTRGVLMRSAVLGLDFEWWLSKADAPLDAEYRAKCAPLYAEYRAKRAPLMADVLGLPEEVTQ